MANTQEQGSSASTKAVGWIVGIGLLGVLKLILPASAVAAAVALGVAALWLLNQHSEPAAASHTSPQDTDLDLPPPRNTKSGAQSRKGPVDITRGSRSLHQNVQNAQTAGNSPTGSPRITPWVPGATGPLAGTAAGVNSSSEPARISGPADSTAAQPQAATGFSNVAAAAAEPSKASAAHTATANKPATSAQPAASTAANADAAPVALTGSAAILAKLRQQRQTPSSAGSKDSEAAAAPKVTVVYASQTGTGQEIARTIHAECSAKGMQAQVMSFNELGFDNLTAAKTPVVVFVASSTGDGDPPDNAAAAYVAIKKQWPSDRLAGIRYTVLGLGDSNYTRFMHVSRGIKSRLQDLGGTCFYACAEADEVDGIENTVDPWCEKLYTPLYKALQEVQQQKQPGADGAAAANGVPAAAKQSTSPPAKGPISALAAEPSMLGAEQSVLGADLLAAVSRAADADGDNAAMMGTPRVQMELSAASQGAGDLSGQASLLGEDSSLSQPDAGQSIPSSRATSASGKAATPQVQLVNGLALADVDLKGVPALAPCRVVIHQELPAAAADAARQKESLMPTAEQKQYRDPKGHYSSEQPFWARISDARLMTADWSDRTVIHLELDISSSGMKYGAGDVIGVLPQNAPALVTGLLQRLQLDGDTVFEVRPVAGQTADGHQHLLSHIPCPCTLRYAFTHCTDLTSVPRKSLLRMLAEHCSNADEQRTLLFLTSRAGRDAYNQEVAAGQPSVLDLLNRFPSCNPPLAALLDALQPLAARMYSLTSAPVPAQTANGVAVPGACGPNRVQFAFSVVGYQTKYGIKQGVASKWLAELSRPWLTREAKAGAGPEVVPIYLKSASFFRPPESLATPLIMIGPGTGVAPFRGFLQQRMVDMQASGEGNLGAAVLYFGSRKPDEDYLYEQDWQAFTAAGALQKLRLAFSRAQASKVYVQHLMKEDAPELAQLISAGAHVYVCGDGAVMAKDVHAALCEILKSERGVSDAQAAEELAALTKAGRYVRDIWS